MRSLVIAATNFSVGFRIINGYLLFDLFSLVPESVSLSLLLLAAPRKSNFLCFQFLVDVSD